MQAGTPALPAGAIIKFDHATEDKVIVMGDTIADICVASVDAPSLEWNGKVEVVPVIALPLFGPRTLEECRNFHAD
jgi:hypothetical protein